MIDETTKGEENGPKIVAVPDIFSQGGEVLNAVTTKGFSLDDHSFLPERYGQFLTSCSIVFRDFILELYNCASISEAKKKWQDAVRSENPGRSDSDLFDELPFLECYMDGKLTYKSLQETQQDNLLREVVETEYLFSREDLSTGDHKISRTMYGVPIGHRQEIEQYANEFVQALNEKYPEREGRVRSPPLLSHVDSGFPEHVELVLTLKSLPTNGLETNISLKDHGASYSSSNGSMESYHAPAIQIRAHASSGPLSLTENVVDVFEKIVKKSYLFNRVNSKTNYTSLTRE